MISPARIAAYDILRAVNSGRQDLPGALAAARRRLSDERDRTLAAEIASGALRWLAELDHVIEATARRPLQRLDPEVLEVLRLTAYQLLHLDRIPASAAVDDAVNLCRRVGKTSATTLVNAVLRTISRNRHRQPLPTRPEMPESNGPSPGAPAAVTRDSNARALDYLSITLSHPRWLAARWLSRFGFEAAERCATFNNSAAPLTLRANTLRTSRAALADALAAHGVATEPARYAPDALIVTSGNPLQTPLAHQGTFLVQDEASQLVGLFTSVRPGDRVLDACASPGGKTLQMAAMTHDVGLIVANDFRPRRIDLLQRTIASAGVTSVRIVRADAGRPLPFREPFDCVLLDAPCSGLGTIRRDPDIRWRRTEADLDRYAAAQLAMIEQAAAMVRIGARVVYATCSTEPEENDHVVAAFLAQHREFMLDDLRLRDEVPSEIGAVLDARGCLRTLPHVHGLEGFFAAILRRLDARLKAA